MLCLRLVRLTPYFFASVVWDRRDSMFCGICFVRLGLLSGSLLERNDAGWGFGLLFYCCLIWVYLYTYPLAVFEGKILKPIQSYDTLHTSIDV